MATETNTIMDKLNEIKTELGYLKKHMADVDTILTEDDIDALSDAEEDLKKGKTVKL